MRVEPLLRGSAAPGPGDCPTCGVPYRRHARRRNGELVKCAAPPAPPVLWTPQRVNGRGLDPRDDGWANRHAVCKGCGLRVRDSEPCAKTPFYWHRINDNRRKHCRFAGSYLSVGQYDDWARKRERRARTRGARAASKLRPR